MRTASLVLPLTFIAGAFAEPICANGGKLQCCQATFAGDLPPIIYLAALTKYPLNPNDVNCIGTSPAKPSCVGVLACCKVNILTPAIGLYCQGPAW